MTNFATFIATANGKAPIAQRGKAKQKRSDLRIVGLGLVVATRRGDPADLARLPRRRPARCHPVPRDDRPAPRQYEAIAAAAGGTPAGSQGGAADMTVVFDAGQNSAGNFAYLAGTGLHYIGSVPASDCPDLTRAARHRGAQHRG